MVHAAANELHVMWRTLVVEEGIVVGLTAQSKRVRVHNAVRLDGATCGLHISCNSSVLYLKMGFPILVSFIDMCSYYIFMFKA